MNILEELACRGITVTVRGDKLALSAPKGVLTPEMVGKVAENKAELMAYLSQRQKEAKLSPGLDPVLCRNSLTPHSAHEFPWECDPDTCLCYRQWQYPRLCQGVPCRWVWPNGVPKATANAR